MTVVVLGSLRFPPENMQSARPHLRMLVDATLRLDGCVAYDVAEDLFDPGLVRFSEVWPDDDALSRHLSAPHIAPWRAIAKALGVTERRFTAFQAEHPRSV